MARWPFGTKEKEQDEKMNVPREEYLKPLDTTEIVVEEEKKPGTGDLSLHIAAAEKWSPAAPQKTFSQNQNHISEPAKLVRPMADSGAANFEMRPEQKQNPLPENVETNPEKNLTYEFGILSIEEQNRLDEEKAKLPEEKKTRKKRKTLGRTVEVKVRLTEKEKTFLDSRVWASGLTQGEFIREAILHEKIETKKFFSADIKTMSEIMRMGSELGKIGGLIKKTVAVNNEFQTLTPELKAELESEIKNLESLRSEIQKVVEGIYGNSKTHS